MPKLRYTEKSFFIGSNQYQKGDIAEIVWQDNGLLEIKMKNTGRSYTGHFSQFTNENNVPFASASALETYLSENFFFRLNSGGGSFIADSVPLIVFNGESNSGGQALNADLTAGELAVRPSVKILNNTTLQWEDLDIGTNNTMGHYGPYGQIDTTVMHGWENGLAHTVENGDWSNFQSVYLVKTGQGGCTIAQLESEQYFQYFDSRVNAAKALIKDAGKTPITFIWYTQGINDSIAGTDIESWKTKTIDHLKRLRTYLGFAPIIVPYFNAIMNGATAYNAAWETIAVQLPFVFLVSSEGAGMQDTNHWNAQGMKLIAERMVALSTVEVGLDLKYLLSQNYALSEIDFTQIVTPPAPLPTNPATFELLSKTANPSAGTIEYSAGAADLGYGHGGTVVEKIDTTKDFNVVYELSPLPDYNVAVVVALVDSSEPTVYQQTRIVKSYMYEYSNSFNISTNSPSNELSPDLITPITFTHARWRNLNANDVALEVSSDGVNYSQKHVHAGILNGVSELEVIVIFALDQGGAKLSIGQSQ